MANVTVTGSIGQESVEFENAATEATLADLLKSVNEFSKSNNIDVKKAQSEIDKFYKSLKNINPELKKINDEQKKKLELDKKANQETVEGTETSQRLTSSQTKQTTETKKLIPTLSTFANQTLDLIDHIANMGDSLSAAIQPIAKMPGLLGFFGKSLTVVANAAEKTHNAFIEAASVGGNFGGSVSSMINAAGRAGLTFDQFAGIIKENGEMLALLGEGSADGAKQFGKLSKEIRKQVIDGGLSELGYTTESANKGMASYLKLLTKTGNFQKVDQTKLSIGTIDYLKNLDALSKLTGKSKDALQAEQDAMMVDAQYRTMLASLANPEDAKNITNLLRTIPEGLRDGAKEVLATGTATTESGRNFMAFLSKSGMSLQELSRVIQGGGRITAKMTEQAGDQIQAEAKKLAKSPLGKTLGLFVPEMDKFVIGLHDYNARTTTYADQLAKIEEDKINNTDKQAALLNEARQKIAIASNKLAVTLTKFTGVVTKTIDYMDNILNGFVGKSGNVDVVGGLKNVLTDGTTWKVAGVLIGAGVVKKLLSSTLGAIFGGGGGAAGAATTVAAGGASKSIGGGIAGIGRGMGVGMSGIAKGLMAFANPAILGGAAVLGGTILIIGAAVAGASWLMSKAMPSIAEGFESFETLNGMALVKAGAGIAAIGAGLAVFGAGGIASGIGSVVSSLGDTLSNALGGKNTFDKLIEFSNLDLNESKIKSNASAVVSFSKAMAVIGLSQLADAPGRVITALIDTFTGTTIGQLKDQIADFESISINESKVKENSVALQMYADTVNKISNISVPSIEGRGFVGSLLNLFGADSTFKKLTPQINEFEGIKIHPNKVKDNGNALQLYAETVNKISDISLPNITGRGFIGSLLNMFGADSTFKKLAPQISEFEAIKIHPNKIKENGDALQKYAESVNKISSISLPNIEGRGFVGYMLNLFGADAPFKKLAPQIVDFEAIKVHPSKVESIGAGVKLYAETVNKISSISLPNIEGRGFLGKFLNAFRYSPFKVLAPQIVQFEAIKIHPSKVKFIGTAVQEYAKMVNNIADISLPNVDNRGFMDKFLSAFSDSPFEKLEAQIKEFENIDVNLQKVKENSKAIQLYSDAVNKNNATSVPQKSASEVISKNEISNISLANNQLKTYYENIKKIREEKEKLANTQIDDKGNVTTKNVTEQSATQDNAQNVANSVNTKLDTLISLTSQMADLSSKQLSVQKSLSGDVFASA